jgi:plastocyanin
VFPFDLAVTTPGVLTASTPCSLFFTVDAALLPIGKTSDDVDVSRNGVPVADCDPGSGRSASPDPCVRSRSSFNGRMFVQVSASDAAGHWDSGVGFAGPPEPPPGFVIRNGTQLLLDGQPFRPIGLDIYNANSNGWCWYQMDGNILDDSLTAIGPGKNTMRAWFFQQLATTGGTRDWTAFDRTLATARAHGYKVIATLTDQWGDCGDSAVAGYGYKDVNWYENAYKDRDPSGTVSYRDWVAEIVNRYKDDPTILAWQLVNEPEVNSHQNADCGTVPESRATADLSSFASDVSALIKSIDPYHLVSLGTIGSGQCGAQADDFASVMSIPTLDLCEFHDYNTVDLVPGDQWNGLKQRIDQCNALGKPLLVGELGTSVATVGTTAARANIVDAKLCAQFRSGVAGVLLWAWDRYGSYDSIDPSRGEFDIGPQDPVLDVLTPWSNPANACSAPVVPTGVVAAAGDAAASISWLPPASNGGSVVRSYTVTASPGAVVKTVTGSQTSTVVTGLTNGTSYSFTVAASNAAGDGPASAASATARPTAGNPTPATATAQAGTTAPTTVSTGSDPAATSGTATTVTVPAGTAGGTVSVAQSATNTAAPSGYVFGGVQVDISAPPASPTNPLVLSFLMTPPSGAPLDATTLGSSNIYRAEGGGSPTQIGDCDTANVASPDPCVASRQYVSVGSATDIKVTVLTSSASHWNIARAAPAAVTVTDAAFTPAAVTTQQGGTVTWTFKGKKAHTVTESAGLGGSGTPLFASSSLTKGTYGFVFGAAGTYGYKSTAKGDSFTGTVAVPATATPSTGRTTTRFSVIWASAAPAGYVFDVQYRFKARGTTAWRSWQTWKTGTTGRSASFVPNQGAGTYAFDARLRSVASKRASAYSPDVQITVS